MGSWNWYNSFFMPGQEAESDHGEKNMAKKKANLKATL